MILRFLKNVPGFENSVFPAPVESMIDEKTKNFPNGREKVGVFVELMRSRVKTILKEVEINELISESVDEASPSKYHFDFCVRVSGTRFLLFMDRYGPSLVEAKFLKFLRKKPLSKRIAFYLGLLDKVKFLHDLGIKHCDLKPDNILQSDASEAEIVDFGLSKLGPGKCTGGTRPLRAPESLNRHLFVVDAANAYKADVFSLAVIIGEIESVMADLDKTLLPRLYNIPSQYYAPKRPQVGKAIERTFRAIAQKAAGSAAPSFEQNYRDFYRMFAAVIKAAAQVDLADRDDLGVLKNKMAFLFKLSFFLNSPRDTYSFVHKNLADMWHLHSAKEIMELEVSQLEKAAETAEVSQSQANDSSLDISILFDPILI